jgi:hypothetical protein
VVAAVVEDARVVEEVAVAAVAALEVAVEAQAAALIRT